MKLLLSLPNGETIDLLDQGPNGMEYVCQVCGEYENSIIQLVEDYKNKHDVGRCSRIADKIRDQSYFFAGEIANYDEALQQMISWEELAEQIYQALITFARI